MPRVQYSKPQEGINITVGMDPPRDIMSTHSWMRKARKAIPSIPEVTGHSDWRIRNTIVDMKMIAFELINVNDHDRCAVVIDRNYNNVVGR